MSAENRTTARMFWLFLFFEFEQKIKNEKISSFLFAKKKKEKKRNRHTNKFISQSINQLIHRIPRDSFDVLESAFVQQRPAKPPDDAHAQTSIRQLLNQIITVVHHRNYLMVV